MNLRIILLTLGLAFTFVAPANAADASAKRLATMKSLQQQLEAYRADYIHRFVATQNSLLLRLGVGCAPHYVQRNIVVVKVQPTEMPASTTERKSTKTE